MTLTKTISMTQQPINKTQTQKSAIKTRKNVQKEQLNTIIIMTCQHNKAKRSGARILQKNNLATCQLRIKCLKIWIFQRGRNFLNTNTFYFKLE